MARRKILSAKFLKLRTGVTLRATQHDVETNSEVSRLIDLLTEHERTGDTSAFVLRALFNQLRIDESGSVVTSGARSLIPAAESTPRAPSPQQAATQNEAADKQSAIGPAPEQAVPPLSRPAVAPAQSEAEGLSLQSDPLIDSLLVNQFESAPARVDATPPLVNEPSRTDVGVTKPAKRKMGAGAMAAMGG